MGYLLKEVLKTICGTNQWSYAVFWKIGCQNPKLLIWEECHYEPSKSSSPSCLSGAEGTELPFGEWEKSWVSSQPGSQLGDQVSALVSKMMISNQVNIMGEGMVGRAAFAGNHQWLLSSTYATYSHPPEVLHELHNQFSAGMQTVSVIPVLPHGVVQLGSSLDIMENIGFVNDVRCLILQLGSVPGGFLSDNRLLKDSVEKIGPPVAPGLFMPMDPSTTYKTEDIYNQCSNLSEASNRVGRPPHSVANPIQNNQETSSLPCEGSSRNPFPKSHDGLISSWMKLNSAFANQFKNGVVGAEVIPSSSNAGLNRQASYNAGSVLTDSLSGYGKSCTIQGSQISTDQRIWSSSIHNQIANSRKISNGLSTSQLSGNRSVHMNHNSSTVGVPYLEGRQISNGAVNYSRSASGRCSSSNTHGGCNAYLPGTSIPGTGYRNFETVKTEGDSCVAGQSKVSQMLPLPKGFSGGQCSKDSNMTRNGLALHEKIMDTESFQALNMFDTDENTFLNGRIPDFVRECQDLDKKIAYSGTTGDLEDEYTRSSSGNDLFDIFGMDFKNKYLGASELDGDKQDMHGSAPTYSSIKKPDSTFYTENEGMSESGIFSAMGTDHLLDAVVSKAKFSTNQSSEDSVSCRTTMTKNSNSSVLCSSPAYDHVTLSKYTRGEKCQLPDSLNKEKMVKSSSFKSGCSMENSGNCSQGTTVYGSQISSWVEQGNRMKHDSNISAAFCKRPDEVGKSNRKRLKPGENPRPRPKDRQMIQDRVKELREIVPSGAKCSIDSLLERTIKHMLFLQSVTKHADKLKHSGESKILNKEGGLLLKDNFEGGATWAFEVGSQSMVCPIIVEDLNTPRQMLVEMLCEERGFFLEIADSIRGMGLTILKGVMEARNDKIWARFAIEANRDVTRMEIFMSLVHLLEQTLKGGGIASLTNSAELNALVGPNSPITATGRPDSLQ